MNTEEFLKKIESLDKKQGNYKDTTQVMAKGKKYRKDVFKNSKKNKRNKMLAELVQGMTWIKIDRDANGFATEECISRIFNNLPCAVCCQTEGGYKYYNLVNEYLDMMHNREEVRTNTGYTHYLPIPKLEV